jgi:hypothetical protein
MKKNLKIKQNKNLENSRDLIYDPVGMIC